VFELRYAEGMADVVRPTKRTVVRRDVFAGMLHPEPGRGVRGDTPTERTLPGATPFLVGGEVGVETHDVTLGPVEASSPPHEQRSGLRSRNGRSRRTTCTTRSCRPERRVPPVRHEVAVRVDTGGAGADHVNVPLVLGAC
jgi:hypothetical protein